MTRDDLYRALIKQWAGVPFEDFITKTIGRESFEHFVKTGELKRMNRCLSTFIVEKFSGRSQVR